MLELDINILVTPDHNNRSRKYHLGTIKKSYVIQITERSCVMQHKGQRQHNTKKGTEFFYTKADGLNIIFSQVSLKNLTQDIIFSAAIQKFQLLLVTHL